MESSINFYHDINRIETSSDEKFFVKTSNGWEESSSNLYKSEFYNPENDLGNNGDYYITYKRRYNKFKYSEIFNANMSENTWISNGCSFIDSTEYKFPYTYAKKMKGLTTKTEHFIQSQIINSTKPYTFSIYIKPAEISEVIISFLDETMRNGVGLKIDLNNTSSNSIVYYGDTSKYSYLNSHNEVIDRENNIYRIAISAQFPSTSIIYAKLTLLFRDSNNYKLNSDGFGLYINAAQLTNTTTLDEYIKTTGEEKSSLTFKNLYIKRNNRWNILENNKIYYFFDEINNNIGDGGDIATLTPILNINPFMKIGEGYNLNKFDRPIGYMYYDSSDGHYYIKTKKSLKRYIIGYDGDEPIYRQIYSDCKLMYGDQKPNTTALAHAILLNQQSYQHYTRCSHFGRQPSFRIGFNASGHGSFYGNVIQRNKGY